MALGFLLKGIIGIAIPAFTIFLFLLIKKELYRLKEMRILPGIIIILTIGTPWYIAEWLLHGEKFVQFALGFLFLSRFGGVVAGHPGPWYYYFLALLLGFAPWSHFLPYSLFRTWKQRANAPELLTLCFIVPVFIVFSIAKTKLPSYLLPIFPFLAITIGKLWNDFLSLDQNKLRRPMTTAIVSFAIVVLLLIIGFIIVGTSQYSSQYQESLPNLLFLGSILIVGSLVSIVFYFTKRYQSSFASIPIMVFIIALILTTQTLPLVENYKGTKELANKVSQVIKTDEQIAAYHVGNRPGVVFYNSKPIVFLDQQEQLLEFLKKKQGYCFTTIEEHKKLQEKRKTLAQQGKLIVIY